MTNNAERGLNLILELDRINRPYLYPEPKTIKKIEVIKPIVERPPRLTTSHLVYAAKYDNEIVYIGSGVNGRERHCTSGCSHVYALNKLHFAKEQVEVVVLGRFNTKEESLTVETSLIIEYKPRFNTLDNPHSDPWFQYDVLKKWDEYFKTTDTQNYKKIACLMKELLTRFRFVDLVSDKGVESTGIRSDSTPELKTYYIYSMLSCRKGITAKNKSLEQVNKLFCTTEGRIKIPIEPPEYQVKESNE